MRVKEEVLQLSETKKTKISKFSIFQKIDFPKDLGSDFLDRAFFQIDITSSDLNEFWIGQKIWKALALLFHLSTTFMRV